MAGVERLAASAALTTMMQTEMPVVQSTLPSTELAGEEQLGGAVLTTRAATAAQLAVLRRHSGDGGV
jgi:hypothetical protein